MLISSVVLVIGEVSYVEEKNKSGSGMKTLEYYTFLEKMSLFTLNIPLLFFVLHYGLMEHKCKCKVIEWVGVYSYPIYLYHILVKFISSFWMGEGTIGYYIVGNLGFIVLCVMIFPFKDKEYILGSVRK